MLLATSPLLLLAVLACPIGMGLMMFFMARSMRGGRAPSTETESVPELKAEQARLAEKIEALERARAQDDPAEKELTEPSRVA